MFSLGYNQLNVRIVVEGVEVVDIGTFLGSPLIQEASSVLRAGMGNPHSHLGPGHESIKSRGGSDSRVSLGPCDTNDSHDGEVKNSQPPGACPH